MKEECPRCRGYGTIEIHGGTEYDDLAVIGEENCPECNN